MTFLSKLSSQGHFFKRDPFLVFFGNDQFKGKLDQFKKVRSHWLQQVHGKEIIEATQEKQMADGHHSSENNKALFIKTADCMPVFLIGEEQIIALHIGWRGLMKKILSESRPLIKDPTKYHAFVGPHIGYQSFQLDRNSTQNLLSPHKISANRALRNNWIRPSLTQNNHYHINLLALLKTEMQKLGIKNLTEVRVDTYQSPFHYSHRRNRWRRGQNFSFCLKL